MGLFDNLKSYGNFVQTAIAAQDPGNADGANWNWNAVMYQIRKQLEFIEAYLGGIDFVMFKDPLFCKALENNAGFTIMGVQPSQGEVQAIGRAWVYDGLYYSILQGNPGVLSDVSLDALSWFNGLINAAVCYVEIDRHDYREYTSMMESWPGTTDMNASWLDG